MELHCTTGTYDPPPSPFILLRYGTIISLIESSNRKRTCKEGRRGVLITSPPDRQKERRGHIAESISRRDGRQLRQMVATSGTMEVGRGPLNTQPSSRWVGGPPNTQPAHNSGAIDFAPQARSPSARWALAPINVAVAVITWAEGGLYFTARTKKAQLAQSTKRT